MRGGGVATSDEASLGGVSTKGGLAADGEARRQQGELGEAGHLLAARWRAAPRR